MYLNFEAIKKVKVKEILGCCIGVYEHAHTCTYRIQPKICVTVLVPFSPAVVAQVPKNCVNVSRKRTMLRTKLYATTLKKHNSYTFSSLQEV